MKLGEKQKISFLVIVFIMFLFVIVFFLGMGKDIQPTKEFRESLIIELIGGGFVALFVSLAMILIQHLFAANFERIGAKREALAWIESILEPEFKSEIKKGVTPWNIREGAAFYFDGTPINRIYSLITRHHENIVKSSDPSDSIFLARLLEFKKIADVGLYMGYNIDLELKNRIRVFNYKRGAISANDEPLFVYARAKIFSNLTDDQILNYVECGNDQTRAEFMDTLDDSTINAWREKVATYAGSLMGALYKMGYRTSD